MKPSLWVSALRFSVLGIFALAFSSLATDAQAQDRWWKGNLHTHSLWSDGDSYPELVVDWYREEGYHFLVMTEHDILAEGTKWIHPTKNPFTRGRGDATLERYRKRFGDDWVETREVDDAFREELALLPEPPPELSRFSRIPPSEHLADGEELVRLRGLDEFRHFFEEKGRFLLLSGVELSALTAHVNLTNLAHRFPLQRGTDILASLRMNLEAAAAQAGQSGQPVLAQVNHPNYGGSVPAERMAEIELVRFFELYNGHPLVDNYGTETLPDTERIWDIALTLRLSKLGFGRIFGLAVDDAHEYDGQTGLDRAAPGRGWVMVRAESLTPEALLAAMFEGDFYASTGVSLRDVAVDDKHYRISIAAEEGVSYRTEFIGTLRGYDRGSKDAADPRENASIGAVLAAVEGHDPVYRFTGDELYVRARVTSDRPKANRVSAEETREMAWTQPVRR